LLTIGRRPSRGLVGVTDSAGKSVFAGKPATGFTNVEEELAGKVKDVPFLLEDRIKKLGGKFEQASEPWAVSLPACG
jgi:hypothetical protein